MTIKIYKNNLSKGTIQIVDKIIEICNIYDEMKRASHEISALVKKSQMTMGIEIGVNIRIMVEDQKKPIILIEWDKKMYE